MADLVNPKEQTMNGAELIAAERLRQVEAEGWTPEHDHSHFVGTPLLAAARGYLAVPGTVDRPSDPAVSPLGWPWAGRYWKPTPDDRVRELVKAGALIAAEIDRLQARG